MSAVTIGRDKFTHETLMDFQQNNTFGGHPRKYKLLSKNFLEKLAKTCKIFVSLNLP
jgi:hypothetical protein